MRLILGITPCWGEWTIFPWIETRKPGWVFTWVFLLIAWVEDDDDDD